MPAPCEPYFTDVASHLLQMRGVSASEFLRVGAMLGVTIRELEPIRGAFELEDGRAILDENERILLCPMAGAEDEPPGEQRPWLRKEFERIASDFAQALGPPSDSFSWGAGVWMCSLWRGSHVVLSVEESFYDDSYGAPGIVVSCVSAYDEAPKRHEGLTARLFRERRPPRTYGGQ